MRLPPAIIPHTEELLREVLRFTGPADVTLSRYFRDNPAGQPRARRDRRSRLWPAAQQDGPDQLRRIRQRPDDAPPGLLGLADAVGAESIAGLQEGEAEWLERVAQIDRTQLAPRCAATCRPGCGTSWSPAWARKPPWNWPMP
jgi:16S rRNA (cytosine967-C5)-methyltransferase